MTVSTFGSLFSPHISPCPSFIISSILAVHLISTPIMIGKELPYQNVVSSSSIGRDLTPNLRSQRRSGRIVLPERYLGRYPDSRKGTTTPPPLLPCYTYLTNNSNIHTIFTTRVSAIRSNPFTYSRNRVDLRQARQCHRSASIRRQSCATPGQGKRARFKALRSSLQSQGGGGDELQGEEILTKMAFAEQQQWITVQQKTFTKWWVFCLQG